jgi:hypothetical protein
VLPPASGRAGSVEDAAGAAGVVVLGLGEAEARRHEGIVARAAEMG